MIGEVDELLWIGIGDLCFCNLDEFRDQRILFACQIRSKLGLPNKKQQLMIIFSIDWSIFGGPLIF